MTFASESADWGGGAVLWVDGELVDVPRNLSGTSRIDSSGVWLDERWFAARLGGFHRHPQTVHKNTPLFLGNVLGVWVYDAVTRTSRSIAPPDDQLWDYPSADMVDGRLVIYNNPPRRPEGRGVVWRDGD